MAVSISAEVLVSTRQYATFNLGPYLFGINVLLVREVNRNVDITRVELAPDYVRGLLNLRGQIVTVIDPGVRLGMGPCEVTKESRCVVLKASGELEARKSELGADDATSMDIVGLLVDRIGDMVTVDDKDIERPPANVGALDERLLHGVVKLEDGLLILLKMSQVLRMESNRD